MTNTPNLILPLIDAAQAQKHVTHNQAIQKLDAITQLAVLERTLTTPPGSPVDGERHIVAASATGAWAGKDFNIAAWQDGAWAFYPPREGWLCWVLAETRALIFTGGAWRDYIGARSPNNASAVLRILEQEITLSGASVASTTLIPNGSIVFGVSERVTQAITGATSFAVGISGNTTQFGNLLGLSLGSTNFGIIGPNPFFADTPVVITANGGNFTGGKVRIAIHHLLITPPQS